MILNVSLIDTAKKYGVTAVETVNKQQLHAC